MRITKSLGIIAPDSRLSRYVNQSNFELSSFSSLTGTSLEKKKKKKKRLNVQIAVNEHRHKIVVNK